MAAVCLKRGENTPTTKAVLYTEGFRLVKSTTHFEVWARKPTPPPGDIIFMEDFEGGNLSTWSFFDIGSEETP